MNSKYKVGEDAIPHFSSGAGLANISKPTFQSANAAAGVFTGGIKLNEASN